MMPKSNTSSSGKTSANSAADDPDWSRLSLRAITHSLEQGMLVPEVVAELDRSEHQDQQERRDHRHFRRRVAALLTDQLYEGTEAHRIRYGRSCRTNWVAVPPVPLPV